MEQDTQIRFTNDVKLTDWKNEPTIQTLKNDFEVAKTAHDNQMIKINKWADLMKASKLNKAVKAKQGRSSVQPKLIRRQAEWRYSALTEPFLSSQKIFSVYPRTFEDYNAAKQNELLLNWQFDTKLNKVKFIDDFVRTTVDEGTCIIRLGWDRITKNVTEDAPIYQYYTITDETQLQQLQQAIQLSESDPRSYSENTSPELKAAVDFYKESGEPVFAQQIGTDTIETEVVIKNDPVVEILNPANVYVDPSCNGDFSKAMFVIISFETNQAELLKAGNRYKNLNQVNWEGSSVDSDPDYKSNTSDVDVVKDTLRKKVVAYEYWGFYDIYGTGELIPIVATWIGDILIRMELNPFPDQKLPFVFVPYLPIKRDLFGEPDAELLEDNQAILGAVTRGMIDTLGRSANSQQGFAKGMLDFTNRKRFENGEDYEFNPQLSPAVGHIEHTYPELPQSAILMVQMQNQEAEALTGVKAFSGGLAGDTYGTVATGIKGMLDAAAKREMAILRRLAKGITEIGEKIIAMNSEFLSEEEVIRVTNKNFIAIRREDIKGNFDLKVDISTAEIDNIKAQDLGFMLQTLGPNMDPSITMMILAEIADLKRMPSLAERLRTWKPQLDPVAEQMKQLELQKLQMEVQKLQSEIIHNQARAEKAYAEAEAEGVDTQQNIDGTKHLRELQKQQAQARGNQKLEVTKALLKSHKMNETNPDVEAAIGYNSISDQL